MYSVLKLDTYAQCEVIGPSLLQKWSFHVPRNSLVIIQTRIKKIMASVVKFEMLNSVMC